MSVDIFAMSRSGHTVIKNWLGGDGRFVNKENYYVTGDGCVVILREFSSWLASYIAADAPSMSDAGDIARDTCEGLEDDARLAADVWFQQAENYLVGESDRSKVYPISSYHWLTSSLYRDSVESDLIREWAPGSVPTHVTRSSWDKGEPARLLLPLQRHRRMRDHPEWRMFREVYGDSKESRRISRQIFMVSHDEEILS